MAVSKVITTIAKLHEVRAQQKREGIKAALVPTMGYLHPAHLSLVKIAKQHGDSVFVSIFVNPTQFNDPNDFKNYPVDLKRDLELLSNEDVDVVFTPEVKEIYGGESSSVDTWIEVKPLSDMLEGKFRPGHFRGVTTVVGILFNIVKPDYAVFGEKDFQQLRVIEKMVENLRYDIRIVRGPLMREPDGLAMSSRNVRLSKEGRSLACEVYRSLSIAQEMFSAGQTSSEVLRKAALDRLSKFPDIKIEYVEIVEEENLLPLKAVNQPARLLSAVWVEGVRLIDNIPLRTT